MNKDPLWRSFDSIFPETGDTESRNSLKKNLRELETIEESFCGLFNLEKKVFEAISSDVKTVLGYPPEKFLDPSEATPFFFSKVDPDSMPLLLKQQVFHFKEALSPARDRKEPYIMNFRANMINSHGKSVVGYAQSVVLNYLPDGQLGLSLGCWFYPTDASLANLTRMREKIDPLLIDIKKLYVKLYPNLFQQLPVPSSSLLINHFYVNPNKVKTSPREQQILLGLAKGSNSRALANELNISFHTVESHRKNLIEKFKAKNTAELIKEASKLYWLSDSPPGDALPKEDHLKISGQEKKVLMGLAKGETSKGLSESLSISFNTAEFHRKNLLRKFEAKNVAQLIHKAASQYWLD